MLIRDPETGETQLVRFCEGVEAPGRLTLRPKEVEAAGVFTFRGRRARPEVLTSR